MVDKERIQKTAQYLLEERQAGKPFGPVPESFGPRDIAEAYLMQEELQTHLEKLYGPVAGYKIALASPVMQRFVGVDEPFVGGIFGNTIYHSPKTLRCADFVRLGIECEIAFELSEDLPASGAPYTRDTVARAIATAMTAFEVIDDRAKDYSKLSEQLLTEIADNASNAGVILGSPITDWCKLDMVSARGTMVINDELIGEGHGSDVMGHPLESVAWLANMLAKRGKSLAKGMIVMSGSIVPTKPLKSGDLAVLSVDGLGEATLTVS